MGRGEHCGVLFVALRYQLSAICSQPSTPRYLNSGTVTVFERRSLQSRVQTLFLMTAS